MQEPTRRSLATVPVMRLPTTAAPRIAVFAKHLRKAHVLPLDGQREWDPDDPTPLATSPAGLSRLLLGTLFDRDRLVDLVEMSQDPLPGLEVTELPASAWPAGG